MLFELKTHRRSDKHSEKNTFHNIGKQLYIIVFLLFWKAAVIGIFCVEFERALPSDKFSYISIMIIEFRHFEFSQ